MVVRATDSTSLRNVAGQSSPQLGDLEQLRQVVPSPHVGCDRSRDVAGLLAPPQKAGSPNSAQSLRRMLRADPYHPEALHALGLLENSEGRPGLAVEFFLRASVLRPSDALVHEHLGDAYFALGEWDNAIDCYQEAIQYDPRLVAAHYRLGDLLYRLGNEFGAQCRFEQVLRLDETIWPAWAQLGCLLRDQGRSFGSLECFVQGFAVPTGSLPDPFFSGCLLYHRAEWEAAAGALRDAEHAAPDNALVQLYLGLVAEARGDRPNAVAYLEAVRRDYPQLTPFLYADHLRNAL